MQQWHNTERHKKNTNRWTQTAKLTVIDLGYLQQSSTSINFQRLYINNNNNNNNNNGFDSDFRSEDTEALDAAQED